MAISVIVSNFNGAHFLPRLLESIRSQKDVTVEIIVVDRFSADESIKLLLAHPYVKCIQEPPETGLARGYNKGAELATHEHLFFCNEDIYLHPGCLSLLEKSIDLKKRICAADPWQWSYDGDRWIHGGVRFIRSLFSVYTPYLMRSVDNTVALRTGDRVPFPCAGSFLIHRNVFVEAGGWDGSFFLDMEDMDLFIRIWQRGWTCVTVPEARVYHATIYSKTQPQRAVMSDRTYTRMRYISHWSNTLATSLKYFSWYVLWMPFTLWIAKFINHLIRFRFDWAAWDILIMGDIGKKFPSICGFRRQNALWNHWMPGQKFFTAAEFTLKDNTTPASRK